MIPPTLKQDLDGMIQDDTGPEKHLISFKTRLSYISIHKKECANEIREAIVYLKKDSLFPKDIDTGYLMYIIGKELDIDTDSKEFEDVEIPTETNLDLDENEEN